MTWRRAVNGRVLGLVGPSRTEPALSLAALSLSCSLPAAAISPAISSTASGRRSRDGFVERRGDQHGESRLVWLGGQSSVYFVVRVWFLLIFFDSSWILLWFLLLWFLLWFLLI